MQQQQRMPIRNVRLKRAGAVFSAGAVEVELLAEEGGSNADAKDAAARMVNVIDNHDNDNDDSSCSPSNRSLLDDDINVEGATEADEDDDDSILLNGNIDDDEDDKKVQKHRRLVGGNSKHTGRSFDLHLDMEGARATTKRGGGGSVSDISESSRSASTLAHITKGEGDGNRLPTSRTMRLTAALRRASCGAIDECMDTSFTCTPDKACGGGDESDKFALNKCVSFSEPMVTKTETRPRTPRSHRSRQFYTMRDIRRFKQEAMDEAEEVEQRDCVLSDMPRLLFRPE